MVAVGIIVCYLLGLVVLFAISRKYSLAELVGYSFLIGIGLETFMMFFLDIVGVKYSQGVFIGLNLLAIAVLVGLNFKKLKEFELEPNPRTFFQLKNINFPAIFIGCIIAYLFYCVTVKCLFWPALERDSVGGFDKTAFVIAAEGKLKISLFDYHLDGTDGVYAPLYYVSMAYVYIFGAELPKIITTLFFLSTLLVFFDITRKYIGATGASLATLLLMLTPEYFSHAALALSNLPVTAYVCAGGLCTIAWLDKRDKKFFWMGAILMGFVTWTRTDMVVFIAGALLLVGIDFLRKRNWKDTIVYSVTAVAPFVIWALYLKFKIHSEASAKFNFGMGFNSEHWNVVKDYTLAYLFAGNAGYKGMGEVDGGQFYGLSFVLFFVVLAINVAVVAYLIYKKSDWKSSITSQFNVILLFFVPLILYCTLYYFFDEEVQRAPMWSLMFSSFKRGLFCFLPISLFYFATSYVSVWFFQKVEKFRTGL